MDDLSSSLEKPIATTIVTHRLRILLSAYACEPGKGSEAGVGWNFAVHMARHHDVWVVTRANNRALIERQLTSNPVPGLHFLYYDLPPWIRMWKRGARGAQLYYYLWQYGLMYFTRRCHQRLHFDLAQHLTFVRYWMPSGLAALPIPFVWGPIGGAEFAPPAFEVQFPWRPRVYEWGRRGAQWLARIDPFLRFTARRASVAYATTEIARERLRSLGVRRCELCAESALSVEDLRHIEQALPPQTAKASHPLRFVAMGRLLALKGYQLALPAFAAASLPEAQFWFIGDGPERAWLEAMTRDLNLQKSIIFLGQKSRAEACRLLATADVLVHPSLHDSGGWTCLEAMAAGKPVLCLDIGGPGFQVDANTGIKVEPHTPQQAIRDLAVAMQALAGDVALRKQLGQSGRAKIQTEFTWEARVGWFSHRYHRLLKSKGVSLDYST